LQDENIDARITTLEFTCAHRFLLGRKKLPMQMEGTTIRQKQCTYEQDEAFGWCSNPQRLWIHPMDNWRLEVDVKNTQHVGRMQQNSKDHQTYFAPSPLLHCFLPKYSSQRKKPNQITNHTPSIQPSKKKKPLRLNNIQHSLLFTQNPRKEP
jgi:hypothetical protein